jgi:hypothetical protein
MKLDEYWSVHYELTGVTSAAVRTLILSGVAVVWLFHETTALGKIILPHSTLIALLCFAGAALFDVIQYAWSGEIYRRHVRKAEKAGKHRDAELGEHESWYNVPTYICFWLKLILTLAAYGFIAIFLSARITATPG